MTNNSVFSFEKLTTKVLIDIINYEMHSIFFIYKKSPRPDNNKR